MAQVLSSIRFLITDWSGVISDDRKAVFAAICAMLGKRGRPLPDYHTWLMGSVANVRDCMRSFGVHEDDDAITKEYAEIFHAGRENGHHPFAYEDALPFVRGTWGQGLRFGVVSSHPEMHLVREAVEYGIAPYILRFQGDSNDKAEDIRRLMEHYSPMPRGCAYMGDTVFDIRAARSAGVMAIGVATGYHSRAQLEAEKPDLIVDSLTELAGLIRP